MAAITALAGGALTVSAPAWAGRTVGAANYTSVAPNGTAVLRLMCPSYAPTMLVDTIAFTPKSGAIITGYTVDTDSDAFSRDLLTATVANTFSAWSGVTVTATCTS
jgi:hypothetical protein